MNAYYAQWDVSDLNSWRGIEADTNQEDIIDLADYMPSEDDIDMEKEVEDTRTLKEKLEDERNEYLCRLEESRRTCWLDR